MADSLKLTFAELEYLLAESPVWPAVRERLGVGVADSLPDVRAAGLSSLLIRELARVAESGIEVTADVDAIVAALAVERLWIDYVAKGATVLAGGVVGIVDDTDGLLVSFLAPGCFDFALLVAREPSAAQVGRLAVALLSDPGEVLLSGRQEHDRASVTLSHLDPDQWLVRSKDHPDGKPIEDAAAAEREIVAFVESLAVRA